MTIFGCKSISRPNSAAVWRRRFWILALTWIVFYIATSFASVRGWFIRPLCVHHSDATGEIAYVMADGPAIWERLRAASDLYHMHRVERIYLLNEQHQSSYNFDRQKSDTRVQREIDYLGLYGVTSDRIATVDVVENDWFSSRSEALGLWRKLDRPASVVIVTSAPHTRRSLMCFKRTFADQFSNSEAKIAVYSATDPSDSVETYFPIWIEYGKLLVYWFSI